MVKASPLSSLKYSQMSSNQADLNLSNLMVFLSKHKDKDFMQEDEKPHPKCQGRVREFRANAKVESRNLDHMPRPNTGNSSKCRGRVCEPRVNAKAESTNLDQMSKQNPGNFSKCQGRVREPRVHAKTESKKVRTRVDLRELISLVEAQSFELRDSNIKLQRLCKAQDTKRRELMHRISLHGQKRQRDEADQNTIKQLEGTVKQKLLQIKNLKSQIELIRVEFADVDGQRKQPNATPARISRSAESYKKPSRVAKRHSDISCLESIYQKVSAIPGYEIESIEEEYRKVSNTGSMAKLHEKVCRRSKAGTDIPLTAEKFYTLSGGSTKRYSDIGSVLSKLNYLLEELNTFCIEDSVNCKGFLAEAQSRIESLLARANGETADVNGKQQNSTDSNKFQTTFQDLKSINYGRSVKVEIFEYLDKGVQVSMDENTPKSPMPSKIKVL